MKSRLLDRGSELMLIYPQVEQHDSRGNKVFRPSPHPVTVRVTVSEDRGSDAELAGQISSEVLRVLTRKAPAGSWGRIMFRDESWDIVAPPIKTPGMSRATRHVEFNIRSRNSKHDGVDDAD